MQGICTKNIATCMVPSLLLPLLVKCFKELTNSPESHLIEGRAVVCSIGWGNSDLSPNDQDWTILGKWDAALLEPQLQ